MDTGDRFGDYVILKRLSSGGMAEVYLARKSGMGGFTKPLAVKVILPHLAKNTKFIDMFLNEARLAVALNHANIAQILDLGECEGQYFIAMEFAHGMDLQQISSKTRKSGRLLPLPYAAKIVSQIAEGLYFAHTKTDNTGKSLEIVHRDVSPHNIILTFDGLAKLIDFGVAKAAVTYKEEEEGILKGKFSYMSPEQIRGMPVDPRSDIFALGIVLWEVCTGAHLYRESSELLTMEAILRKPVPKPRDLRGDMPPDLEAIILKALAKRSVDRFQTAYDMHAALENYLGRSGWNVGTPHLSEFMKKLFPREYSEIRDLLEQERRVVEAEQKAAAEEFVPWEPYEGTDPSAEVAAGPAPARPAAPRPATDPRQQAGATDAVMTQEANASGNRRSWLSVFLVILLALLCLAAAAILWQLYAEEDKPAAGSTVARPTSGQLTITSTPAGARISVNGKARGKTPATLGGLPLDEELTVRLELDGFEDSIHPVKLRPDKASDTITVKLKKL